MQPHFTEILCATDLSQNSQATMESAVKLAKMSGAKLHVLHVVEAISSDAAVTMQIYFPDSGAYEKALQDRMIAAKTELEQQQRKFWSELPDDLQSVRNNIGSIEVIEGHPAEAILSRAKALDCDLVVLGAHDHGTTHTFLGSVAKRVLRRSNIPTLVVPTA